MSLSTDDLIKIEQRINKATTDLEIRLKNELASKEDVNLLKDLILDIRSRLNKDQIPFLERVVDRNTKRIERLEAKLVEGV